MARPLQRLHLRVVRGAAHPRRAARRGGRRRGGTGDGPPRGRAPVHRGQRKGLGVSGPAPLYVTALDAASGAVTVGPRAALERTALTASGVNWIEGPPRPGRAVTAQIRHHHAPAPARVRPLDGAALRLEFDEPQPAIAPGQAVVLYDGDVVLGGGWID